MRNDRGYIEPEVILLLFYLIAFIASFVIASAFDGDGNGAYRHTDCIQASNANFVICKSDYDTLTLDKRKIAQLVECQISNLVVRVRCPLPVLSHPKPI